MRWPWSSGKSAQAQLIELLREERANTALLQQKMLDTMGEQARFMQRYLGMFENAPTPQIRVMTDATEAEYERERNALAAHVNNLGAVVDGFDPSTWAADINALKREM